MTMMMNDDHDVYFGNYLFYICFTATGFLSHETLMGGDDDDDDNDVKSNGDGREKSKLEDVDNGKIMMSVMMITRVSDDFDNCNIDDDDGVEFRMMMERKLL